MGTSRQRYIAIGIVVTTLLLTALFLAQGSTRLLAAALLELDPSTVETGRGAATPPVGRERRDPTPILARNIFDSQLGPLDGTRVSEASPAAEESAEPEEVDPNAPLPACEGAVRLVGSLVNVSRPEWSFAAIASATGKAMLYRAGNVVDGRLVLAINPSRVVLRPTSGGPCQLAMFDPVGADPAHPAAPVRPAVAAQNTPAEPPGREGAITAAEMESGISRVSDTQYTVTRSLVDKLLENQAELMRTARIIPHEEGGRTVGVKLYGIRRNSLLGRLGLQNGDMLRTINGFDMTSPDSALEAYSRLRSAENLTISMVRRGQATTVDYDIQ